MLIDLRTVSGIHLGPIDISETDTEFDVIQRIKQMCAEKGQELRFVVIRGIPLTESDRSIKDFLKNMGTSLSMFTELVVLAQVAGTPTRSPEEIAEQRRILDLQYQKERVEEKRRIDERRELVSRAAANIIKDEKYLEEVFREMKAHHLSNADVRFNAVWLNLRPLTTAPRTISLTVGTTNGYYLHTAFSDALHEFGKVAFLSMADGELDVPVLDDKNVLYNVYPHTYFFVNVQKHLPGAAAAAHAHGGRRRRVSRRKKSLTKRYQKSKSKSLKRKRSRNKSKTRK